MKRLISALAAMLLLCQGGSSLAYSRNSDGLYVDDSGKVIEDYWDDSAGIYIVDGVGYDITNSDSGSSSGSSSSGSSSSGGGMVVSSSDGSIDITPNADGSITVESGQIQIVDDGTGTGSGHLTEEEFWARMNKYKAANGTTTGTAYVDDDGNVYPAEIVTLGLGRSTITIGGQKMIVPTSSLIWDTEAPEDQRLAVVTPSKQSYITLRAKKSSKAFVMAHCEKCEVLRVISVGKTWTMVDHLGDRGWIRGYVITSGLTFYDNKPKNWAAGIITINGKTPKGKDFTVHVRSLNSNKSRQIAEYPAGTMITVFAQDEKWSEIDVEGLHCYILNQFVTLQEPLIVAAANPEESAENID